MIVFQYTVTFLEYPRKKFDPVMCHKLFPFASPLINNVRHQPQIVLNQHIPGVLVSLGHPL